METVDTLQTSGQSQKYFPAQLVAIIIHELFGPACLFSSDSHRAEAAGSQGLCWTTRSTAEFKDSCRQEGVHRVNISQSLQTGQSRSEVKTRFRDFPCFYTINDLRKKSCKWYIHSIDLCVNFDRENVTSDGDSVLWQLGSGLGLMLTGIHLQLF